MKKIIFLFILLMPMTVSAIETSARSAILIDTNSKRIMYSKDIHNVQSVASISKIMTGLLACESGKLDKKVKVGDEIEKAYGSGIYIKKGEKLTLRDLVYGLMLRSGNDAALAISTFVSGNTENFVVEMNKKAKEIGMKNTTFNNPHGLDEKEMIGNYSTAYDMAILMSYAVKNKELLKIMGTKTYKLTTNKNTYVWNNKNKLLKQYKYITGGKTGFTTKARRTLVSSAYKDNMHLAVVTLNDGNDFSDHKDLYEYGFSTYKNYQILKKGTINIFEDEYYNDYELYIKNDFYYPLLEEEKNDIILKIELEKERKYKRNSMIGYVKVILHDEELGKEKIYIKGMKKEQTGIFKKIKDFLLNDK